MTAKIQTDAVPAPADLGSNRVPEPVQLGIVEMA